jgi:hypothetical protein
LTLRRAARLGRSIRFLLGLQAVVFVTLMATLVWANPSPARSWSLIVMCVVFGACHGLLWRASAERDRVLSRHMREEVYEGTKQAIEEAVSNLMIDAP